MALLLQECRIEILRAVAEEIERRHQQDRVERQLPMRASMLRIVTVRGALALEGGRFRHFAADVENEQRRHDAHHEHAAPADMGIEQRKDQEASR